MSGPLEIAVYVSPTRSFGQHGHTFSPTTSTLVSGTSEAVLVDAQFTGSDVGALGDMIERSGKSLTTIFITHAHIDHYLGIGELVHRFPGARPVAARTVAAQLEATHEVGVRQLSAMFGGALAELPASLPRPIDGDAFELDGHELFVLELGQGDISPSTALYVPAMGTVLAGDIAYNRIHPMLAYCDTEDASAWIGSIDAIEALRPTRVIAGHKAINADDTDLNTIIAGTRQYIQDFLGVVATSGDADGVVAEMTSRYPTYGNATTLFFSATAAILRKE